MTQYKKEADERVTRVLAAGLVEEGVYLENLEKELAKLKELISKQQPICPICQTILEPVNYRGYYDEFACYECLCETFPNAPKPLTVFKKNRLD